MHCTKSNSPSLQLQPKWVASQYTFLAKSTAQPTNQDTSDCCVTTDQKGATLMMKTSYSNDADREKHKEVKGK